MSINQKLINNTKDDSSLESSLKHIIIDTIKYSPSKFLGVVGNLITVPIYTKLLTPSEYGLYNIAIAFLSFICILFSDWVGSAGLRFFKQYEKKSDISNFFSNLFILLITNIVLMFSIGYCLNEQLGKFFTVPPKLFFIVLLLVVPVAFRALLFQILRAQIRPYAYTISTVVNQFSTILLASYFIIYHGLHSTAILLAMGITIGIIDIIMLFQSDFIKLFKFVKPDWKIFKEIYAYGLPLAFASISLWIINQSNKFILQYFKGSFYNGISGVGFNLTFSILLPIFSLITIAAFPRIIEKFESGSDVRPVVSKLTGYFILFCLPIAVIISFFALDFVKLMADSKFHASAEIIPYLAFSVFFVGLTEYTAFQYHLAKKTYYDTAIRLVPGVLGIFLNILLIPKLGLTGVGISTLVSYLLYFALSISLNIKELKWILPTKHIMVAVTGSLIASLVIIGTRSLSYAPIISLLSAILSYVSVSMVMFKARVKV